VPESTRSRCLFVDLSEGAGGRANVTRNAVTLCPPDSGHLDLFGDPRNEMVEYRGTRLGTNLTRRDMTLGHGLGAAERTGFAELWGRYAIEIGRRHRPRTT
jgi:hypothetical protein